jgi:hypothetical protein
MRLYTLSVISCILSFYLIIAPSGANASSRVALIIGNSEYQVEFLKTPVNDAQDMSDALTQLVFEVMTLTNADRREMLEGLNAFSDKLKKAEIGLVFYAGHAIQSKGVNYLIPLKADIRSAADVEYETVQVDRIVDKIREAGGRLNIVILDACRKNPYSELLNSSDHGLAPMESAPDTIIAYSALPGSFVHEGTGRNSTFTKHLLRALEDRKLTLRNLFDAAGIGVMQETSRQQIPWTQSPPIEPIYLVGDKPAKTDRSEPTPVVNQAETIKTAKPDRSELTPVVKQTETIKTAKPNRSETTSPAEQTETIKDNDRGETQWGWLEVNSWPGDASIRVLNIGPKYKSGMKLPAGRYHIEVSKAGYKILRQWVELAPEEHATYDLELEIDQSNSVPLASSVNQPKILKSNNASSKQKETIEQTSSAPKEPSVNKSKVVESSNAIGKQNVTVTDSNSRLMWSANDNGRDISWGAATGYCNSLVLNQYSNWRMPTSEELKTLFQGESGKSISTNGRSFWSSSQSQNTAIRFDTLRRKTYKSLKSNSIDMRVLCVRQLN